MLVAIISDVHNNEVNLQKVLNYCKKNKISTIICCGDLASQETLDFFNANFSEIILYTFGNADYDDLRKLDAQKKYKHTFLYKDFGEANIEKKTVAFTHYPETAKSLARTGKYNFVFHGHTHKPWEEIIGNCKILNPGNVSGDIYPPTFAVWNTEDSNFKLIRVHDLK
jgi:hypothetical protein